MAVESNVFQKPQPYDLSDERELMRLVREVLGYLETCKGRHHGTDMEGRAYALAALRQITTGEVGIRMY